MGREGQKYKTKLQEGTGKSKKKEARSRRNRPHRPTTMARDSFRQNHKSVVCLSGIKVKSIREKPGTEGIREKKSWL